MNWTPSAKPAETLRGQRVLIVDDESVIALELEMVIGDAGGVVVGPVGDLEDAVALAKTETISAAVLDVRLGGRTIEPVAEVLAERGVPFVFYSGQVQSDLTLARWPSAAFVQKPAPSCKLIDAVAGLIAAGAKSDAALQIPPLVPPTDQASRPALR